MDGSGDCNVLQFLYDGDESYSIFTGWRDNIVDKAGYLTMYVAEGISILSACNSLSTEENLSDFQSAYSEELLNIIDRIILFDEQAQS